MPGDIRLAELVGQNHDSRHSSHDAALRRFSSLVMRIALLTGTLDVDDTAPAKLRVPRIAADIAAQMPATYAFGWLLGLTSIHTSAWLVGHRRLPAGYPSATTRAWQVMSKNRSSSRSAAKRAACAGGA